MNKLYEIASNVCENNMDEIKSAIKRLIILDYIGRNEGLLAMESFILEEEEYSEKTYVDLIVGYIVDGRAWEEIEGFLTNRILMMDIYKKRYLCFLYKECLKIIQTGKFFYWKKECICSLIPEKYQSAVSDYIDEVDHIEFEKWNDKKNQRMLEEYSQISVNLPEEIMKEMKAFEKMANFKEKDSFTQTWLRYMEYSAVYLLLLVGSDKFKEIIFSNMSSRMKMMAKEELVNLAKTWDTTHIYMVREAITNGIKVLNRI